MSRHVSPTNSNYYYISYYLYYLKSDKWTKLKANSFWVLLHVLCFVNALMNLIGFEFGDVLLVKSTESGLNVYFQLGKFLVSVSTIAKVNYYST